MEADPYHEYLAVDAEKLAGQCQGRAPLPGSRFGGDVFSAGLLVEIGLGNGGIKLMGSTRGNTFVLVIDMGGCVQRFLKPHGPKKRGGAPEGVDIADLFRNVDSVLGAHLLHDEVHGKDGGHQIGCDGLLSARVKGRRQGGGEVGKDVVPLGGNIFLGEIKTIGRAHGGSFSNGIGPRAEKHKDSNCRYDVTS